VRWARRGIWENLFRELAGCGRSADTQMIDSTHIKAHRSAAGGKGGRKSRLWAVRAEGATRRSMHSQMLTRISHGVRRIRAPNAPLAGGLDIVRKTLGRYEIAAIQATSIDRDSGTAHHHAGALIRRMAGLGLAGLSAVGAVGATPDGSRPHLRSPLCAIHRGRDRRRG
jgi:hypothetical protein